jgi:hypothetical protein
VLLIRLPAHPLAAAWKTLAFSTVMYVIRSKTRNKR